MPLPKKETNIIGLPNGVSATQEDALWGDSPFLRPKNHKDWLAHFIALEFGLARMLAGWVPACGDLEWKLELPRIVWEQMQRAKRMRERLEELTGTSGAITPDESLVAFITGIGRSDQGSSFVEALITKVFPALSHAYGAYIAACDEVFDAPTLYILRLNQPEVDREVASIRQFIASHPLAVANPSPAYADYVDAYLAALGGLTPPHFERAGAMPKNPVENPAGPNPDKRSQDPRLRLRFGFPETKQGNPTKFTLREIVYHNATEWQVIDPMCEIFHALPGMPMDFFVDFSRHIWDECRHARMGMRRLVELGYKLEDFEWSHGTDRVTVMEDYFAGLTMIGEACSFTRKKGSIPLFLKVGDTRSAMLPEVDCADEQLHVTYGHRWVAKIYEFTKGLKRTREDITREQRELMVAGVLAHQGESYVKDTLESFDPATRAELVNSFAGFCGLIEFKMDMTVY